MAQQNLCRAFLFCVLFIGVCLHPSSARLSLRGQLELDRRKVFLEYDSRQNFTRELAGDFCNYYLNQGTYEQGNRTLRRVATPGSCCVECMETPGCTVSIINQHGRCYLHSKPPVLLLNSSHVTLHCHVIPEINPFSRSSVQRWPKLTTTRLHEQKSNPPLKEKEKVIAMSKHREGWPSSFFWGKHKMSKRRVAGTTPILKAFWDMYDKKATATNSHSSLASHRSTSPTSITLQLPSIEKKRLFQSTRRREAPQKFWQRHFKKRYVITLKERAEGTQMALRKWGIEAEGVMACTPGDVQRIMSTAEIAAVMVAGLQFGDEYYRSFNQTVKMLSTAHSHVWALERCKKDQGYPCLILEASSQYKFSLATLASS